MLKDYHFIAAHFLLWPTLIIVLFFSPLPCAASNAAFTEHRREAIVAQRGAVAADDGRCSWIGMEVLREGGHAVDAAVAAALCLGVVSPASSGIGGGAFMLVSLANGKAQAFDMRETAPLLASEVSLKCFFTKLFNWKKHSFLLYFCLSSPSLCDISQISC